MADYDLFSQIYDDLIGDREFEINLYKEIIDQKNIKTNKILELACGTGQILQAFSNHSSVYGIDISQDMLNLAKQKMPEGRFYHQNMTEFSIDEEFDLIICAFDSINHLRYYKDWIKVFEGAYQHLRKGGAFIFDMNTVKKLNSLKEKAPFVAKFGPNYMITYIEGIEDNVVLWDMKAFKNSSKDDYKLIEIKVIEATFYLKDIDKDLTGLFSSVERFTFDFMNATDDSVRAFYVCRK